MGKFPYIQVYLKPIMDVINEYKNPIVFQKKLAQLSQDDLNIDNYRPELRLGAFEVQLATKENNKLSISLIYSKLRSKQWPILNSILREVAKKVPATNLLVRVLCNQKGAKEKSMEGIKVNLKLDSSREKEILKKFTEDQYKLELKLNHSNSSKMLKSRSNLVSHMNSDSFHWKIPSLSLRTSASSLRSVSTIGRKRIIINCKEPSGNDAFAKYLSSEKTCQFDNIPIQNYVIQIEESQNYEGFVKQFPISNDINFKKFYTVNIEINLQNKSFISVNLIDNQNSSCLEKGNVYLIFLGNLTEKNQCFFDIAFHDPLSFNQFSKCYESTERSGKYLLGALHDGFSVILNRNTMSK